MRAISFLSDILHKRLCDDAWSWCKTEADTIAHNHDAPSSQRQRQLGIAFSSVVRHCGKDPLALNDEEYAAADTLCPGWRPQHWSLDIAARVLFVLMIPHGDPQDYHQSLDTLFQAADLNESIALYSSLPLLPMAQSHVQRAQEGLRSNVQAVFTAIAHHSPFPKLHFQEGNWNQMILKALFIDVELYPIIGLDDRSNPELTRMLCDYAHERWAASRSINPELWRCVGHCASNDALKDLEKLINSDNTHEQHAATLALKSSPLATAQHILDLHPELLQELANGLQWPQNPQTHSWCKS